MTLSCVQIRLSEPEMKLMVLKRTCVRSQNRKGSVNWIILCHISLLIESVCLKLNRMMWLTECFDAVSNAKGDAVYFIADGLLMHIWKPWVADDECFTVCQIGVPAEYRSHVLSLAHGHVMAGHLGVTKTYNSVLQHCLWPRLKTDFAAYCHSCHTCQVVGKPNQVIPPAPLIQIPALGEPFEHVDVDCVGPLPKTKTRTQFLLTVMCMATHYPEAFPLRKMTPKAVMKALEKYCWELGNEWDEGVHLFFLLFVRPLRSL